jgi:hypothetical protein
MQGVADLLSFLLKNPFKGEEYAYFLQSRSADEDDEEAKHIYIVETGILYCPWCGTKLAEITRMYNKEISEIAAKNKRLIKV